MTATDCARSRRPTTSEPTRPMTSPAGRADHHRRADRLHHRPRRPTRPADHRRGHRPLLQPRPTRLHHRADRRPRRHRPGLRLRPLRPADQRRADHREPVSLRRPIHRRRTGFQYLRARHYDPTTGQFLSRDPLEAQPSSPTATPTTTPTTPPTPAVCSPCATSPTGPPAHWIGPPEDSAPDSPHQPSTSTSTAPTSGQDSLQAKPSAQQRAWRLALGRSPRSVGPLVALPWEPPKPPRWHQCRSMPSCPWGVSSSP